MNQEMGLYKPGRKVICLNPIWRRVFLWVFCCVQAYEITDFKWKFVIIIEKTWVGAYKGKALNRDNTVHVSFIWFKLRIFYEVQQDHRDYVYIKSLAVCRGWTQDHGCTVRRLTSHYNNATVVIANFTLFPTNRNEGYGKSYQ